MSKLFDYIELAILDISIYMIDLDVDNGQDDVEIAPQCREM